MLELGRYNQTTRNNRYYSVCGSNQIKDEVRFLFHCSIYSMIMNNFYNKVKFLMINELMNSSWFTYMHGIYFSLL